MDAVAATEFRLLGPVRALAGAGALSLGGPKQRALLAELLLHGGELVTRDHLVDALWGETPPESAAASLQVYVHGLRRAVGAERIETHGSAYRIRLEPRELDLRRFELLVDRASQALADGHAGAAAEDLDAALALWAGPPLADIADQPVALEAGPRLDELRLRAVELRVDAALALGEHDGLVERLETLVAEQPYRERLREQQMLALYRVGRQAEALDAFRRTRRTFVDELGMEPGAALQELERAILRQDPSLAAAPREERERPPALPTPPTPLVGRRLEAAAVEALLRRDDVRLVTLTGAGGTGKTRLAIAVAAELGRELRDGAVFVDLAAIHDADLVVPAVGRALDAEDPLSSLADRSLLLVLDNLEQLGDSVEPVAVLLAAGPRVRVLATSRTPLRLSGEHEYPVPPLPVPAPARPFEEIVANDAVRLFAARAQAVDPSFSLTDRNAGHVAGICRRLDGLPLAIELAAARSKVLAPAVLEERLAGALDLLVGGARDLPARQRTLRATLDWSYALLAEADRTALAELSVFADGFTLAGADAVLGGGMTTSLEALVDASLVRRLGSPDTPRFALLETIREYAAERLAETGRAAGARRRHAGHFLRVAEDGWAAILQGGGAEQDAYRTLDAELDNLRAATEWAFEERDAPLVVRFGAALRWFMMVRGRLAEGRRLFERALELASETPHRAAALAGCATFSSRQGDVAVARAQFEAALELYRTLEDLDGVSRCVAELGGIAVLEGDLERASARYEESIELFEQSGNRTRLAVAYANLAAIAAQRGAPMEAAAYGDRAVALQRENGDVDGLGVSLANRSRVDLALDDVAAARAHLGEALEIATSIGYQLLLAYILAAAGELAVRGGEHARGAELLGASDGLFDAIEMPMPPEEVAEQERTRVQVVEALGVDATRTHEAAGRAAELEAMIEEARKLTR